MALGGRFVEREALVWDTQLQRMVPANPPTDEIPNPLGLPGGPGAVPCELRADGSEYDASQRETVEEAGTTVDLTIGAEIPDVDSAGSPTESEEDAVNAFDEVDANGHAVINQAEFEASVLGDSKDAIEDAGPAASGSDGIHLPAGEGVDPAAPDWQQLLKAEIKLHRCELLEGLEFISSIDTSDALAGLELYLAQSVADSPGTLEACPPKLRHDAKPGLRSKAAGSPQCAEDPAKQLILALRHVQDRIGSTALKAWARAANDPAKEAAAEADGPTLGAGEEAGLDFRWPALGDRPDDEVCVELLSGSSPPIYVFGSAVSCWPVRRKVGANEPQVSGELVTRSSLGQGVSTGKLLICRSSDLSIAPVDQVLAGMLVVAEERMLGQAPVGCGANLACVELDPPSAAQLLRAMRQGTCLANLYPASLRLQDVDAILSSTLCSSAHELLNALARLSRRCGSDLPALCCGSRFKALVSRSIRAVSSTPPLEFCDLLRVLGRRPVLELLPPPLPAMIRDANADWTLELIACGSHRGASDMGNRYPALGNTYSRTSGTAPTVVDLSLIHI
eukprot:TRINITY_DN5308_c0_g1_i4.p1 TRINITY_DN5308_c0_g1~~TRINITY_DN5308_c0_g1_i4.p1  ORF type:complete len:564 (-),score=101.97 TRINITY_DN5308_c0_g1_i4:153-1844(-)